MFLERHARRTQAAEDEAAIVRYPRHLHEAELGAIEILSVRVGGGDAVQFAVQQVGPAVIHASEGARVALALLAYGGAAMTASIEQELNLAGLIACHVERLDH